MRARWKQAEIPAMGRMDRGVLTVRGSIFNATDYRTRAGCEPVDPVCRLCVFRASNLYYAPAERGARAGRLGGMKRPER